MKSSRRTFLRAASIGALTPSAWLLPRLLQAQATPTKTDRYFVFAYFSGGWDCLVSLDPRDPDVFSPDQVASTGIQPAYDRLRNVLEEDYLIDTAVDGMTFGPFIGALSEHADKIALLRGMTMDSVAHLVARRHVLTGILPAGTAVRGSSVATLLAYLLGENEPIPNLVAGLDSFNIGHPLWASGLPTSGIEDLYESLSPGVVELLDGQRDALEEFFDKQEMLANTTLQQTIYGNRRIARGLIEQDLAGHFDVSSSDSEMLGLREHFGINSGETGDGGYMALLAAQALTKGISRCVTIRVADNLDSHQKTAWETLHGPRQQEGFDSIAALASYLEATPFGDVPGDNWLNHTTIMCFSEFGRTEKLNSNGGRDHNLINSMLLLGGDIQGGQVIGATSDLGMQAQAVDLLTGQVSLTGELIGNNHIARTLLHSVGVEDDVGDFRESPVTSLLKEE